VNAKQKAGVLAIVAAVSSVGVFAVDAGTTPDPVGFEDTVRLGMSSATVESAESDGYEVPRAEVFYSQYGFVVGYVGIETFARNMGEGRHEHALGVPTKAYVTDFSGASPSPADGFVDTESEPDWTDASEASYVVGTGAVVPFSSAEDAEGYADEYGGEVLGYDAVLDAGFASPELTEDAEAVVEERAAAADGRVRRALRLLDRNVSVTVDTGGSVQEAVDAAPPNTTVRLSEGVYDEHVVVDKPLTVVGEGDARIVGHGNGTVVTVESDGVAVSSVGVSGVGSSTEGEGDGRLSGSGWDSRIQAAYGGSDAAVFFNSTDGALVHDVTVETPATGVLFLNTGDGVVAGTEVQGTQEWADGFMGVLAVRSPVVVQNSTLVGGRDGVYSHASDGLVVRDSRMEDGRFGVHLMYTSEALVRGNRIRDEDTAGAVVMTSPTSNYLVGNDVRGSTIGITAVGSRSYFADNVLVDNEKGLQVGTRTSLYTRNVVAGNDVGIRASAVLPSNRVTRNDFVENDAQATSGEGGTRVWGEDSAGNYWSNAPPGVEVFRPTDPVDSSVTTTDGVVTVRSSPAYGLLHGVGTAVSGARSGGIVDEGPLDEPVVYEPDEAAAGVENAAKPPTGARSGEGEGG